MLQSLTIKNYALIKDLNLKPSGGLSAITGETGAGKSIMLGAIGLLLGERADSSVLFLDDEKCIIEGEFDLKNYDLKSLFEEEELDYLQHTIFRRELIPGGRTRGFINDTPVRLDAMKRIGSYLMDVHSQHDTLLLAEQNFQMNILDAYAGNSELKAAYLKAFKAYRQTKIKIDSLESELANLKKEADYNRFIFTELDEANLSSGEQEASEAQLNLLENAEEIKQKLFEAQALLDGTEFAALDQLRLLKGIFSQLSKYSNDFQSLAERTESILIEAKDILAEVENESDKIILDPEKAEIMRQRLDLIYRLQQKHLVHSVDELMQLRNNLSSKLGYSDDLEIELERLKKQSSKEIDELKEKALALSNSRTKVITGIAEEVAQLLGSLGMPNASLRIVLSATELGVGGADKVSFLFSANKGLEPRELKEVASGGEFSRLMFVLKYILAGKTALPTIIFDEIDTGISGEIALKMAKMMRKMAENHQVITITHLPQIASAGLNHFFVYKDESAQKTVSRIRQLDESERVLEIAKMIGGDKPGEAALTSARELMSRV
jgi:DNA repair protein RecN (Recombination protein N)